MRLTGYEAIEYAERECLTLNKKADHIDELAVGLSIAEAEAIAEEEPDLIWLDVSDEEYYGPPHNMEPGTAPTRLPRRAGQRRDELAPGERSAMGNRGGPRETFSGGSASDDSGDNAADTVVNPGDPEDPMADGFDCPPGEMPPEPQAGHAGGAVGGTPAGKRVKPK